MKNRNIIKRKLRHIIAVDLSDNRLSAVGLHILKNEVRIVGSLSEAIPADVDITDNEWAGRWLGRVLREHKLGNGSLVFVVGRGSVGMKRLVLPTTDQDELPGMVGHSLSGQLPFDSEQAVSDYVVLSVLEDNSTELIAAAMPNSLLQRYREIARASGFKLKRVTLRPLATAAIVADRAKEVQGALLAIDLRDQSSLEVVVEWSGSLRFARGIEIPRWEGVDDRQAKVKRIAVEIQRSWMSYRITEDAPDIERVIILGPDGIASEVASGVRATLDRPTEVIFSRENVTGPVEDLGAGWALVGVGLEYFEDRVRLDFLNPNQPPDLQAIKRQRVLAGFAAIFIIGLVLWQLGFARISNLQHDLELLESRRAELAPERAEVLRNRIRLQHVERWERVDFDWLAHIAYLSDNLPDTTKAILGSLSVSVADDGIAWDRTGKKWVSGSLSKPCGIIQFGGISVDRVVADSIRAMLVNNSIYDYVQPIGSDAPGIDKKYMEKFSIRITTTVPTPYPVIDAEENIVEDNKALIEQGDALDNPANIFTDGSKNKNTEKGGSVSDTNVESENVNDNAKGGPG